MPRQTRRAASAPAAVTLAGVGFGEGTAGHVLRDVNLILTSGSFHFLTGPASSGKSILLDIIGLRRRAFEGRVVVLGHDLAEASRAARAALRRRIGHADDGADLAPNLPVADAIALPLRLAGIPVAEASERTREMLAWAGLAGQGDRPPQDLSTAQRRRVALARAVVTRPELLLVDQEAPDPRALSLITSLHGMGTTVLMAGRDPAGADVSGARLLRLEAGRLADMAG